MYKYSSTRSNSNNNSKEDMHNRSNLRLLRTGTLEASTTLLLPPKLLMQ